METDYNSLGDSVKKILALTEENNRILKAIRRDKWIGMVVNIVFWGVLFYFSYVLTMQFMGPIMEQFGAAKGASGGVDIQKLLQQYQSQIGK